MQYNRDKEKAGWIAFHHHYYYYYYYYYYYSRIHDCMLTAKLATQGA